MNNCIYKITSLATGRFYIGSAINYNSRKRLHLRQLAKSKHHNILLQRHYHKYGVDDFLFEIIEHGVATNSLIEREQYYIDTLNPVFNICKVAGSRKGVVVCDESRKRISQGHLGLSNGKHKESTKEKIRASLVGKKHSEERRMNMRLTNKRKPRKPLTHEHKMKISKTRSGMKFGPQTKEHIAKRTKYLYGNKWNVGKPNRSVPIVQIENGVIIKEYSSVLSAAREYNTTSSNIIHAINGRSKTAKKYEWKYKKDITS